ncbi:HlyD family secretion protein [Planctomycetes bacterium CA13]|uniref:HlyD family secretion protein n=1 Tax=Novipirellula herctigrandis TaxID=2527986 RepID=A0A5C5YP52_9BACT|nr:HlyD family secretion protein [Planctomycetes bacterium CA13]
MSIRRVWCLPLLTCLLISSPIWAAKNAVPANDQAAEKEKSADGKAEKKTDKEETKDVQESESIKIDGVFESVTVHQLAADTEQIDSFGIRKIIDHGKSVRKNEAVVWFETKDIDEKIVKAETDLALAKLALSEAEFAFEQFNMQQSLDREAAERSRGEAKQNFDNFVNVDRQQQIATAEYQLKSSRDSLEYAQEELNQLEKMYKEDELTEESEEIVLKRAQRAVENAKHFLKIAETRTTRVLEQSIPNQQAKEEAALDTAELVFAKKIQGLKDSRERREIEMRRQKREFEKQKNDLNELRKERRGFVIQSPINGLAYHGKLTRGRLSSKPSTLEKGSKVTAKQILITVVDPNRLRIFAELSESQLADLKPGANGTATPVAFPKASLPVRIQSIASVPFVDGKWECVLSIRAKKGDVQWVPGMTCKIEFQKDDSEKVAAGEAEATE